MTESEIREHLARYSFYHIIPLTETIATPGNDVHVASQQPVLAALRGLALQGKRVLDVGCRDGLYSFEAERRGAAEVIGIDNDLSPGAVEFLIPFFDSRVRMHALNLLDLTPDRFGRFDLVIFAGVLYHLRYPFQALRILRDVLHPGGTLLIETAIFYGSDRHAMLYCPIGDDGPYGYTSCSFFNEKGLVDTLTSLGLRTLSVSRLHPGAEAGLAAGADPVIDRAVFVCEATPHRCNELVEEYWHGLHDLHSRLASRPVKGTAGHQWKTLPPGDGSR